MTISANPTAPRVRSLVREVQPASPPLVARQFAHKLATETDASDLWHDLRAGSPGLVVLDVRSGDAYAAGHVPGARSLPHRAIDEASARALEPTDLHVVYCWGPHCNGADKAALALASLGLQVKVLIGGIWGWQQEGHPLEAG